MGELVRDYDKLTVKSLGKRLESELVPLLEDMEQEAMEWKADFNSQNKEFMRAYLGIPTQSIKSFPWYKASNVYVQMTRVILDGLLSQIHDSLLSGIPQVVGFEGSDLRAAEKLSRFYFEHVWNKLLSLKMIGNDFLFNTLLSGTGVVKNRWSRDLQLKRFYLSEYKEITEPSFNIVDGVEVEGRAIVDYDQIITEERRVVKKEQPEVEVIDLNRFYPAPQSRTSLYYPDTPWFFEEIFLTWDEVKDRQRVGWENVDEALEASMKERPEEFDGELSKLHSSSKGLPKIRALQFFMRLVLPGSVIMDDGSVKEQRFMKEDGFKEEVIVIYLPETKKVARIIPLSRIRADNKRPYIVNHYKRLPNFLFGLGVPYCMRHMQRMINQLYNQMIDYGTIQNLPFFFYDPAMVGQLPESGAIQPGAFIPVGDPSRVTSPRMQGDRLFWTQALQTTQTWVERDSAINDFNLGRAPEVPNAPRTFRGQAQMLNQANIAFGRLVEMMAEPFTELLRQVHALYQKNAPPELEFEFFNDNTQLFKRELIRAEDFREDVDFHFLINPNRMQEQQNSQMLFQLMMQLPYVQQQPEATRALARDLYESMGKKNFEEIWPEEMAPSLGDPMMAEPMMAEMSPEDPEGEESL